MSAGDLTWQEIAVHAKQTGNDEIADWIMAEQVRRESDRLTAANEPLTMRAGTFEVGHWYNVTTYKRSYKQVQFTRRDGWAKAALNYLSGKNAYRFYSSDLLDQERLDRMFITITEVSAPKEHTPA